MIPHLDQWAVWAATQAEAAESIVPNWLNLLIAVGVFLIPYGLGVLIARLLKLKEYAFKISLVLFAATLGIMPFLYQGVLRVLEQQHYERQLAEYELKKDQFKVTQETLDKLQEERPELKINRPLGAASLAEISPAGE